MLQMPFSLGNSALLIFLLHFESISILEASAICFVQSEVRIQLYSFPKSHTITLNFPQ
jgi:hypothetical protein